MKESCLVTSGDQTPGGYKSFIKEGFMTIFYVFFKMTGVYVKSMMVQWLFRLTISWRTRVQIPVVMGVFVDFVIDIGRPIHLLS